MADIIDIAQDAYEKSMALALNKVTMQVNTRLLSTGYCLNCSEVIPKDSLNKRFCDAGCRDSYDQTELKGRRK